jgi:hypothetical protein
MPRGGRPQALTTWEKRYVVEIVKLVTVCGLDSAIEKVFFYGCKVKEELTLVGVFFGGTTLTC